MQKMTDVEDKVDNIAAKVDEAVKMATEAKENAKEVRITVETLREDVSNMKNELDRERKGHVEWQTMIERKVAAAKFKDPMQEESVQNQKVKDKLRRLL